MDKSWSDTKWSEQAQKDIPVISLVGRLLRVGIVENGFILEGLRKATIEFRGDYRNITIVVLGISRLMEE